MCGGLEMLHQVWSCSPVNDVWVCESVAWEVNGSCVRYE